MAGQAQGASDHGYTGLVNMDGTLDHMNSVVQCLYHTQPLRRFFCSRRFEDALKENDDRAHRVVNRAAFQIGVLISQMWNSKFGDLRLTPLIDCLRGIEDMRRHVHIRQPAHYFLRDLLDEMEVDLRRDAYKIAAPETIPDAPPEASFLTGQWMANQENGSSIICDLFSRQIAVELVCDNCRRYQPSWEYLEAFISYLNVPEPVGRENFNAWFKREFCGPFETGLTCNLNGCTGKMQRYYYVWRVPRILIIQLVRRNVEQLRPEDIGKREPVELAKNTIPVELPDEINLSECIHNWIANKEAIYDIYAVVHHRGEKTNSGHYFAFAEYKLWSQRINTIWRKYDDNTVTDESADEALASGEAQTDIYAAFYRLREPEEEQESIPPPTKKSKKT